MSRPTGTRREFIADDRRRGRRLHHRAPARPRRPAVRRAERQGERRDHRRRRPGADQRAALFKEPDCQIIALADPAEEWDLVQLVLQRQVGPRAGEGGSRSSTTREKTPNHTCAVYEDFRVMLEKEKAIDAVLIATPDHLHAFVSILAMKAGKHVYCEKPLTHNIREARLVARVAKETERRDADGQPGPLERGPPPDRRVDPGRRDRHRARSARLGRRAATPRSRSGRARDRRPSRPGSTGISGSVRAPSGRTAASSPRSSGAGSGTSATGRCPTWRRTTSIPAFNALGLDAPQTIEAPDVLCRSRAGRSGSNYVTFRFAAKGDRGPLTVLLVRQRPQAGRPARHRSRRSGAAPRRRRQRPDAGRRQGHHHLPRVVGDAAPAADGSAARRTSVRRRPCPAWPATTPTGCRPARAARPRAATSTTARDSPSSCCSARWRCGPARS